MILYLLLLFIAGLSIPSLRKRSLSKRRMQVGFGLSFLVLTLVPGLRSVSVGTDSINYVRRFEYRLRWSEIWAGDLEPGYSLLCALAGRISDNYMAVFFLVAIIVVGSYLLGIWKFSVNPRISVFIYITSGIYTFFFNGVRQGLAASIMFLAIGAILRKKLFLFLCFIPFAFLFHKTSLVMIPAYFLIIQKNSIKFSFALMLLGLVGAFGFDELMSLAGLIDTRYEAYFDYVRALGIVSTLYLIGLCLFFVYFKKFIRIHRTAYEMLTNMVILGAGVSLFSVFRGLGASGIMRLNFYFTSGLIIIFPIIFQNLKYHKLGKEIRASIISLYVIYYILTLNQWSNLVPYKLNPILIGG